MEKSGRYYEHRNTKKLVISMRMKIVSDSSCNVFHLENADYTTVPMKILIGEKEYVDKEGGSVRDMIMDLRSYKGKTGSSCANVHEWLDAMEGDEDVFCVTISKNLSGSFNAAQQAAALFMEEHPGQKAFVVDSLTAGPEMIMLSEKLRELINAGLDFETVKEKILEYHDHTHTIFCLESLDNLARNGRIHPAVAKIAGALNIRIVGIAKDGTLHPIHKPRGDKKSIQALVSSMQERGLVDGNLVRIAHCAAEEKALSLKEALLQALPGCKVIVEKLTMLCSYYAEEGGLIIGFEGSFNEENYNHR